MFLNVNNAHFFVYMYVIHDGTFTSSGQPIAWCITNYETTQVVEVFLNQIKSRSPTATVTVLMTDDGLCLAYMYYNTCTNSSWNVMHTFSDDVFCSAARTVYGDSVKHILCRWHVDR